MRIGRTAAVVFALAFVGTACDDGGNGSSAGDRPAEDAGGEPESISKGTFLIEPREGEEDASDDEDEPSPRTEPEDDDTAGDGDASAAFETVTDSTETVAVDVPSGWTDLADAGVDEDGDGTTDSGFGLAVATDLEQWADTWGVSGLVFSATAEAGAPVVEGDFESVLAANAFPDDCVDEGVETFTSDAYAGELQYWSDCGGTGTQWVVLAAQSADGGHGVILTVALAPADEAALDTILESLTVTGPVEG